MAELLPYRRHPARRIRGSKRKRKTRREIAYAVSKRNREHHRDRKRRLKGEDEEMKNRRVEADQLHPPKFRRVPAGGQRQCTTGGEIEEWEHEQMDGEQARLSGGRMNASSAS